MTNFLGRKTTSNNLCKLNSYRHSGLAYQKTVTIQVADKEKGVVLGTTKKKKQNKFIGYKDFSWTV
ncbi:unnamed protein product [Brassica oleracea]|uniref:Uncharacterized protein n=2 Tax=Brassica TaxID=3705 RepID=A0A3P6FF61_BRAOL|nr:unnamed protein product [Brassica napus]VDD56553.1 unnamed protein product [Brassica oleracea]